MDTGALRQKILDLAIRGKLVPQDPNDEPASILLDRIRAEKQQMVKDGKLKANDIKNDTIIFKAEDNLHYEKFADGTVKCIEDEIPFDVPKGWAWCRIPTIAKSITAGGDKPDKFSKCRTSAFEIPIYSNGIQENGLYGYTNCATVLEPSVTISARGTIGFACPRYEPYYPIVRLISVTPIDNRISIDYITLVLSYLLVGSTGSSIPQLTVPLMSKKLIPLPSPMEQTRIVETTKNLFNSIGFVDEKKEDIHQLLQASKAKILDLAIRGKLVPQDPNDEPASVLIERIRAEKEELIKQGKIKRDKNESVIFKGDDNSYYEKFYDGTIIDISESIPYEIPTSWVWARLNSICSKIVDGDHNPPRGEQKITPFLMASSKNINNDMLIDLDNVRYLSAESFKKVHKRTQVTSDDVLFTSVGSIGRSCIYNQELNICFQRSVSIMTTLIVNHYLKITLDSGFFQKIVAVGATGNAQVGFYLNQLGNLLIPVPPVSEQVRISEAVKICHSQLSVIENVIK